MNATATIHHLRPTVETVPAPIQAPAPRRNLLAERAVLVVLSARMWTARKLDRKATDETNSRAGASADAGRFNKLLLPKTALAEIERIQTEARGFHYGRTRAWIHSGPAILPTAGFLDYSAKMQEFRHRHESAVPKFLAVYPALQADQQSRLGSMFDPAEYPSVSEIEKRFTFDVKFFPVPDASDFRTDLSEEQAELIRDQLRDTSKEATAEAMRQTWTQLAEVIGRMVDKLKGFVPGSDGKRAEGIFRDSLVENVRQLAELLPGFNLTNDPILADIASRMSAELCRHDAKELRESDALRDATAKAAESILVDVRDYML